MQLDAMAASGPLDGPSGRRASEDSRRLCFKGMAVNAATKMLGSGGLGQKALSPSGSALVSQEFEPSPGRVGSPGEHGAFGDADQSACESRIFHI